MGKIWLSKATMATIVHPPLKSTKTPKKHYIQQYDKHCTTLARTKGQALSRGHLKDESTESFGRERKDKALGRTWQRSETVQDSNGSKAKGG